MSKPLPCISCGAILESALPGTPDVDIVNQPYKGTVFTSTGQYGSTVFDPITGADFIEITVCDSCLVNHKDRVLRGRTAREITVTYEPWDPDEQI